MNRARNCEMMTVVGTAAGISMFAPVRLDKLVTMRMKQDVFKKKTTAAVKNGMDDTGAVMKKE